MALLYKGFSFNWLENCTVLKSTPTTSQKIGRSFARSTSLKSAQNFVVIIRHSKPDNKLVDLLPGPRSSSYTNNLLYHLMLNTLYSDKITRGWKLHTICPVLQQVLMPLLPFLTIAKVLFSPTKSSIWYRALFSANYLIKQQFLKTRRQSSLQNTCIIWMTIHFTSSISATYREHIWQTASHNILTNQLKLQREHNLVLSNYEFFASSTTKPCTFETWIPNWINKTWL